MGRHKRWQGRDGSTHRYLRVNGYRVGRYVHRVLWGTVLFRWQFYRIETYVRTSQHDSLRDSLRNRRSPTSCSRNIWLLHNSLSNWRIWEPGAKGESSRSDTNRHIRRYQETHWSCLGWVSHIPELRWWGPRF